MKKLLLIMLFFCSISNAQEVNVGQHARSVELLNEAQEKQHEAEVPTILVTTVEVTGNKTLPPSRIKSLMDEWMGRNIKATELAIMAKKIKKLYERKGLRTPRIEVFYYRTEALVRIKIVE